MSACDKLINLRYLLRSCNLLCFIVDSYDFVCVIYIYFPVCTSYIVNRIPKEQGKGIIQKTTESKRQGKIEITHTNDKKNTYVDFFTLTTHINYRIYKPKARLVNWKKKCQNLFLFFKIIDLECAVTFLLSLLERGWFCYCVIS
jgi:hypothetical protein